MKKHGFTLIEIIICIILITSISVGTTIVVIKNNEKKEQNTLKKYETTFDNALEVYLSNHEEITNNLNNYAKSAAVTLEVLKNDGLISDDLDIDYKNNYYLLSNAQLLNNGETTDIDCANDVVGIEIFKKWDLSEYEEGKKVIYICPKNNISSFTNTNIILQEKYSGSDPNNYIKIENVLWRIVEITNSGAYIISTSKDDLITYNDYNSVKTNSSEKYYNDYLEPNSVFISEYTGDYGHYGLDVAGIESYTANIGTLNYTTVMNSTNVSGNYLIELLANMDTYLYCSVALWQKNKFFTSAFIKPSELSDYSIIPVIKLKTCLKINSGTGTIDDPFEIDNKSC